MPISRTALAACALVFLGTLQSCIGISSDVNIRAGGGGTIALEYRISKMLESMGKLDGNEKWLPLPVGRTDFERTVSRIPGLSLSSHSMSRTETDVVVKAELSFSDLTALAAFLDSGGRSAQVAAGTVAGSERSITLRLSEGGGNMDADLDTLVRTVFAGYALDLRFTLPGVPTLTAEGPGAPGSASVSQRTARYAVPVYDLLAAPGAVTLRLAWRE